MPPSEPIRVAIIDNSIDPSVYTPVAHWAGFLEAPWQAFRAPEGKLPGLASFSHFILTGSEASILDLQPWVADEIDFVNGAFEAGKAILGSCYGHQLLARALAGPACVGRCREPEIGWIPVDIKPTAPFSRSGRHRLCLLPAFRRGPRSAGRPVRRLGLDGRLPGPGLLRPRPQCARLPDPSGDQYPHGRDDSAGHHG